MKLYIPNMVKFYAYISNGVSKPGPTRAQALVKLSYALVNLWLAVGLNNSLIYAQLSGNGTSFILRTASGLSHAHDKIAIASYVGLTSC